MRGAIYLRLTLLAVLVLSAVAAYLRARRPGHDDRPRHDDAEAWPRVGQWHEAPAAPVGAADDTARLLELGYLEGSKSAPAVSGVTVNKIADAMNFYVSGDAAKAYLIDGAGAALNTWEYPRERAFPELTRFVADADADRLYWRWATPRPDGSIIAVYEGAGLVALDWQSQPLWTHQGFNHHELDLGDDGNVYTLGRTRRIVPWLRPTPVVDDTIEVLSGLGELEQRLSVLDALRDSEAAELLAQAPSGDDLLHSNAVRALDGTQAAQWTAFTANRLLVSIRELDALVVIDRKSAKVVWHMTGSFRKQHAPLLLANGNLLLFDNRGAGARSRVLELKADGEVAWTYDQQPFYSETCGTVQRLPDGDTLITETETGRAFEVTPLGATVWEFWNPHRTGTKRALIAALFAMQRLPGKFFADGRDLTAR